MTEYAAPETIRASKTNPRQTFPDDEDLVASIREHGILEDLLVRPANGAFELVDGERRWRVARKLKLATVPIKIMEADDEEAEVIQIVKTVQRENVHPVEEADAYARLEKRGRTVEEMAARVGKSVTYIRETLQLASLVPVGKKLFLEGGLLKTAAFKIARLPSKAQETALADLQRMYRPDASQAWSIAAVTDVVQRRYLPLSKAPFDAKDPGLVPKAGACTTCPSNTAVKPELFADVKSATCTNPACYRDKTDADWAAKAAEAQQRGEQVMSDKKAKQVFSPHGVSPEYVDLAKTEWDGAQMRSWKQILGKDAPATITARNPHTGEVHELVDAKEARAIKRRKEAKKDRAAPATSPKKGKAPAAPEADPIAREVAERVTVEAFRATLRGVRKKPPVAVLLRTFVRIAVFSNLESDWSDDVAEVLGVKAKSWDDVLRQLAKLDEAQLWTAAAAAMFIATDYDYEQDETALHKALGVDSRALAKAIRTKLEAEKKINASPARGRK